MFRPRPETHFTFGCCRHLLLRTRFRSLSFRKATSTTSMVSVEPQRVFHLKVDPLTGTSEWVIIEEDDVCEGNATRLLGKTSYLDMLNDSHRNAAFLKAIEKTVTKPCRVLDIGSGTGLLSMMAARAMESNTDCSSGVPNVTACESYLPMAKLMRTVVRANNLTEKIKLINKRSDELTVGVDIPCRADVLVCEILDSELLGEGLIPTLQHAHDTLLTENPQTVPYRAVTYGQLVETTFFPGMDDLYDAEERGEFEDGVCFVPRTAYNLLRSCRQCCCLHVDPLEDEIKLMSEPFRIFEFDFWRRPESHRKTSVRVKVTGEGKVDALISWWVLQLDTEGTVFYSTAPKWIKSPCETIIFAPFPYLISLHSHAVAANGWRDHWKQCVWFFPGRGIRASKHVHISAVHNDTHVSYAVTHPPSSLPHGGAADGCCRQQRQHINLVPERVSLYGEKEYRLRVLKSIENGLGRRRSPRVCVIADDSLFLAVAARRTLPPSTTILLSFPGLQEKGLRYLEAAAEANAFSMNNTHLLNNRGCLDGKIDLFICEPFYYGHESMLPWENLRFWVERSALDSALSEGASVIPCRAILKACPMSLPDLWRSRRCLKEIEGFDHSPVNTCLGAYGDAPSSETLPFLSLFVWQCGESLVEIE